MVFGCTCPLGWLPAEYAWNRPAPSLLRMASAMIDRAELPVQRNRTLYGRSIAQFAPPAAAAAGAGCGTQHAFWLEMSSTETWTCNRFMTAPIRLGPWCVSISRACRRPGRTFPARLGSNSRSGKRAARSSFQIAQHRSSSVLRAARSQAPPSATGRSETSARWARYRAFQQLVRRGVHLVRLGPAAETRQDDAPAK